MPDGDALAEAADQLTSRAARKGKVPPHDLEAERAALGSILLDNSVFPVVAATASASDFYHPSHGVIYEAVERLARRGEPVDVVTLAAELRDMGRLNTVGGAQYIGELTDTIPTVAHVESHARIVHDLAGVRRMIEVAHEIVARGYGVHGSLEAFTSFVVSRLREATPAARAKIRTAAEMAQALFERMSRTPEEVAMLVGVPTGLLRLDEKLRLDRGRLYVFAARPAMGKSAVSGQIAHHVATLGRGRAVVFSEEMPALEVAGRWVAGAARVSATRAERSALTEVVPAELTAEELADEGRPAGSEVDRYVAAINKLHAANIVYDDTPSVTIERIEITCRTQAMDGPLALVVIDYLQLMKMPEAERHDLALGEITRRLKSLAKELDVPIIAVSQLNRSCETRPDKRPMLSDLRDSGSVEQDADGVVFIYRDEVYRRDSPDRGIAEVIVAKQRNGPTGTARLKWIADQVRFGDTDPGDVPPPEPTPEPQHQRGRGGRLDGRARVPDRRLPAEREDCGGFDDIPFLEGP